MPIISEAKLARLIEYNKKLKEQLEIPRMAVSEASARYLLIYHSDNTIFTKQLHDIV